MLEPAHRRPDGSLLLGKNLVTGDERHLNLTQNLRFASCN
ncbi:hypothetical protein myaer87_40410 [Microcystis aeruginosa 11-30S32]|uniref:Uncharacterized protein n=2 Tax=Microcystis TaxID=1125 RepID=A0A510PHH7_MICAE|nr:hypothetical protein myaer87_40410 [Microcystis aeruginosa 11-30S32]